MSKIKGSDRQATHILTEEVIEWLRHYHDAGNDEIANGGVDDPNFEKRVHVGQEVSIDYYGRRFATMWVGGAYGYSIPSEFIENMDTVEPEPDPLPQVYEISLPTWMFTDYNVVAMWEIGYLILVLNKDKKFEVKFMGSIDNDERIVANKFLKEHPLKPNYTVDELPVIRITSDYDERRYFAIAEAVKIDRHWRNEHS